MCRRPHPDLATIPLWQAHRCRCRLLVGCASFSKSFREKCSAMYVKRIVCAVFAAGLVAIPVVGAVGEATAAVPSHADCVWCDSDGNCADYC